MQWTLNTKGMHIGTPLCVTSAGHTMFTAFQCYVLRDLYLERGPFHILLPEGLVYTYNYVASTLCPSSLFKSSSNLCWY